MSSQSELIQRDIHAYLQHQQDKTLLRFITCGSVDDGKSTLIGRLLWDSKQIFEDQLCALEQDSKRCGTQGEKLDYALLLDGLQAEREQGITIDVAYRFFTTAKRKFIVADTPGHEQYTRNMITGASTAQLAVILIDARKGLLSQSRRHSYLCSLVGIRHIVLAINKMDLVAYDQSRFDDIVATYQLFAQELNFASVSAIPLSALEGDNVLHASSRMPWYAGPSLMELLEEIDFDEDKSQRPLRMAVQWVNRPNLDFRGFCGTISAGSLRPGDDVQVGGTAHKSKVARIVTLAGDLPIAVAGQAVTLTLEDEIDISRGDLLTSPAQPASFADRFTARLAWLHADPLLPGRSYLLKIGTNTTPAQVDSITHKIDVNTLHSEPGKTLMMNEVGICTFSLNRALCFDPYGQQPATGSFILIDRLSYATVGAGMIEQALPRATDSQWQNIRVDRQAHALQKHQRPQVLWFTGLPGAGKSSVANLVEKKLYAMGKHSVILDGDNLRHNLNRDLGYEDADQVEHMRRSAEVARLLLDAGLIVLAPLISPFAHERRMVREILGSADFCEIYIDTPQHICAERDKSGAYRRVSSGELTHIPGIDSRYEIPENPDLHFDGGLLGVEDIALQIVEHVFERNQPLEWQI